MERWEREQILREGGVRDPSPLESADSRMLADDLVGSPLRGRPLPRRLRNFLPSLEGYVAAQIGPPAYVRRLRDIEAVTAGHEALLRDAWLATSAACHGRPDAFARRWRALADGWNFTEVNDLIERHNRWFPVEARLAMDPRTGDFVLVAGKPYRLAPLDAEWVLERFPAVLSAAA
jgi:hypothetical protein